MAPRTRWARSCSGPEALLGPIRVAAAGTANPLALTASPNPSRKSALLSFAAEPERDVVLEMFDVGGRRVATVFRGKVAAGPGSFTWSRTGRGGERVPAGLYFARLEGLGRTVFTRVTVLGD